MNKMLLFNFKNKKQIGEEDLSMVLFKRDEIILLKTHVGTRFFCGPITMLGSHMKDPLQYDL